MSIHVIQPRLLRSSQSLVDRILPIPKSAIVGVLAFTLIFTLARPANTATAAPVGQGFTVTTSDLAFILRQIKIAEAHVANTTSATGPCGALIGPGADHVPDALTSYGLRTVDGTCNNLIQGREKFGAADQLFPRLTAAKFNTADERSPFGPPGQSTYAQKSGSVVDSQPRVVSNLIVDQTSTNPAAIHAAGFPVRSQQAPGKFPCTTDPDPLANPPIVGVPGGCVPTGETLFVPNITTDVGLSPPYNSLFTLFGQFFDHGVDQTVKGGGTVFVPLKEDDPLRTVGPDGKAGSGDEVSPQQAFMVLTRAQNQPGSDPGTADPGGQEHRLTVRGPVADLHLPRIPPGVPAGVRQQQRRQAGVHRQAAGRASRPDRRRHGHLGNSQGAGGITARPSTGGQGRAERPADGG
jgi:hypothetical protein